MTDLMLDQFGGIPEEELRVILEKKRKDMIDTDVDQSEANKSRTRELDSHIEFSHLSWLRFPLQCLTKMLSRCGSIPGANFLIALWRGGSL